MNFKQSQYENPSRLALELFFWSYKIFRPIYEPENLLFINPMWSHTIIRNRRSRNRHEIFELKNSKREMIYGAARFFWQTKFGRYVFESRSLASHTRPHHLAVTYEPSFIHSHFFADQAERDLFPFYCANETLTKFIIIPNNSWLASKFETQ